MSFNETMMTGRTPTMDRVLPPGISRSSKASTTVAIPPCWVMLAEPNIGVVGQ